MAPTKQISTSVGFQDAKGNLVANGFLKLVLSQNAEITSGGGQVTNQPLVLALDANAKITTTTIWFNDELTPSGTTYHAYLIGSNGLTQVQDFGSWSISGASADLSAMIPTTTGASYPNPVLLLPSGDQNIQQPSGTEFTVNNFNNRIYVDGVKYTLDRTGIAAAIADACAMTGGLSDGTTLYLPPMDITVATGFTITAPIRIIGAGMGATVISVTSGALFTLSPSANYSQNQEWEIAHLFGSVSATDAVIQVSDANGFQITHVNIHDNVLGFGATTGWAVKYAATMANGGFDWKIEHNYMFAGISITADSSLHGLADGLLITGNMFDSASSSTTVAMQLDSTPGASQWTVLHNRAGWGGAGILSSRGTAQLKILFNQFEITSGTGDANGAMIDLTGSTYAIDGSTIVGNNINCHSAATKGIRLDSATHTYIDGNTIANSTDGIVTTSNATHTFVGGSNVFITVTNSINAASGTVAFGIIPAGNSSVPAIGFIGDATTGIFAGDVAGYMSFTSAASRKIMWGGAEERLGSGLVLGWSNSSDPLGGAADTGISRDSAGVIDFGAGTQGSKTATLQFKRMRTNGGTALASGDFALSAGWGSTASIGSISGTDTAFTFTVTANGTGLAANPTVTLTFKDGTFTNAPIVVVTPLDTGAAPLNWVVSSTATTAVLKARGSSEVSTPVAGIGYGAMVHVIGR